MYTKCGNLCGQRGRKRFIASWDLRMSHFVPAPHAPPPKGIDQRSKVVILPTTGRYDMGQHTAADNHLAFYALFALWVNKADNHLAFYDMFLSWVNTLLQGLTLISGTQTGCRRLDSYIEQKKFLACGPEFSVEFSAPPEFSGGVTEKYLSSGWARTLDLQFTKQILYQCATAPLCL